MTETKRPTNPEAEEILGLYFPVLDSGFCSLIDYMGTDQCIETAARVSYGAGTRKTNETRGLLRYLKRHQHSTPTEMVELKFHCCMPIFVARQWIRHRTANVNEYSGRYSLMPMVFYTPSEERLQTQNQNNKQGSSGESLAKSQYEHVNQKLQDIRTEASNLYNWMTENEVAKELARIDLPLSTYTQWYWKIDLHNLMHFLKLRVDSHAQWEIQEYGKIMAGMFQRVAPLSYQAWLDYDVNAVRFSAAERNALSQLVKATKTDDGVVLEANINTPLTLLKNDEISKRELDELIGKLSPPLVQDFTLDLSKAKLPEYFEEKMRKATVIE